MSRSFMCTLALVLSASASASELRPSDITCSQQNDQCPGDPGVQVPHDAVGMIQLESHLSSRTNEREAFRTGGDQMVHEKRSGESASTNGTLPTEWLEKPFKDFSIQCSHNTFLHGSQCSDTVDASVVYTALELGYRCVEIDVYVEGGNLVVHHDSAVNGIVGTTNRVSFKEFVKKIKEWCEQDERKNPSSFKLPLILNIQNEAKAEPAKLKSEIYDALGPRIVMPADFTINTPLKKLVIQGQGEKRKVLLRSTRLNENSEYAKIVAMSKLEDHGALTKSIGAGFMNKNWFYSGTQSYMPSDTNLKDVAKAKKANKLVRTFPHMSHWSSVNYKPFYFFKQKAHMICINFQGRCPNDHDGCKGPIRAAPGGDCHCARDVAAGLEKFFRDFGYDGYVHLDTLGDQGWDAIAGNSDFRYDDEWKHSHRRRLPYPPKKDWTPFEA